LAEGFLFWLGIEESLLSEEAEVKIKKTRRVILALLGSPEWDHEQSE
jgi:hypothetical protein